MTDLDRTQELLRRASSGDAEALEGLFEQIYGELRRLAHGYLGREQAGLTLQTTALVHEAYLRLVRGEGQSWNDRRHFFLTAARAMRRILIDRARSRRARRESGAPDEEEPLLDQLAAQYEGGVDLIDLHDALERLAAIDAERAKLVELRYFGGLGMEEIAPLMGLSLATVERRWAAARAWLRRELGDGEGAA
jgi:RNA polymerase sigma factor (TIGR02999 family)